jgi:hypothetical protein
LGYGVVIGAVNVILNFCRVRGLEVYPGTHAFPTMYLGAMVLSLTAAVVLWRERFRGRALAGVVVALIALALIHLF